MRKHLYSRSIVEAYVKLIGFSSDNIQADLIDDSFYIEERKFELDEIVLSLKSNEDPEVAINTSYVPRQVLNLGSCILGGRELV